MLNVEPDQPPDEEERNIDSGIEDNNSDNEDSVVTRYIFSLYFPTFLDLT